MQLIEQVKELLKGIDQDQSKSAEGWWETSTGASFGKEKLEELINLIKAEVQ
jgi:hypothetical protein